MGERGTIDVDPFGCHHLRLTVQRQVPRVFADDDVGDERLGRQTAFDEPCGGRCLDDACRLVSTGALAASAGVLRSPRHDHPVFGWDLVETLGTILADHMEIVPTAGARLARWLDDDLLARQMGRKMAAIDFACLPARRCQRRVGLLHCGLSRGDRGLQVLEAEIELILAQPLRLPPEVIAPKLAQHVQQTFVLIGQQGLLAALGEKHRLQALDVVRQIVGRIRHRREHVACAADRQRIILPRVNLPRGSCLSKRRLWRAHATHVDARPIEPLEKRGELGRR